ncbi:FAD/NAD(P)-binding domain-containing protein [Corynespora cassiicola Philippines]|uniref:FAD/NAD(P)-binding domain-containing protein n=1 Tax=Corynespora cassiicola Philippines TaxID=1448308 RepID=A0A2T2P6S0_CORCC|nr:FAD/NAD(P)-binding domain-containing protein [Corynespora cassiicola Philippines]
MSESSVRSVAIIGAGAAGAIAAAALVSENAFEKIKVFERREVPGGTWVYDADPGCSFELNPGKLPPEIDPPLKPPATLPTTTKPSMQYRYDRTPIYSELTTNVPEIIMSFSDERFTYGPFVPHWIPKQYIQNYFSSHGTDRFLVLNTTVENVTRIAGTNDVRGGWNLTLRRHDPINRVDSWWEEQFDSLIIGNGHYSVPFIPFVKGLDEYAKRYPGRVSHSKLYRTAEQFNGKRILVIGNSASGHDVTTQLVQSRKTILPVYQSRRSRSRWDGEDPPEGVTWKPVIEAFNPSTGEIIFEDGSTLGNIDSIVYCTGYKPSYPFWNSKENGGPLFDYKENRAVGFYQHTFSRKFPESLGLIGLPRVLTFRSFEYQAVALARLFAGRNARPLPSDFQMDEWEKKRAALVKREKRGFHTIQWDDGETMEWFRYLYNLSGLPVLEGEGRFPPVLDANARWAYDHVKKYPEPGKDGCAQHDKEWVFVKRIKKDSAHFI